MDAVVHRSGEGETHRLGNSSVTIKAVGDNTGGTFFLSETIVEPGFPGPPPHVHRELHDMFFVLEGTLTMRLGDETMEAGPETFVCVPPGVVHAFSNRSDTTVRFLNFNTPSGWESYMRDLGREFAGDRRPTSEAIGRIASRYDFHPVS
jgi:mannose-6-phosphate isomerase-like protein (cupin superfamily)